jgi:glycosyltransferase involved in cell wall biosynthesis
VAKLRVLAILGTLPEATKLCPVLRTVIAKTEGFEIVRVRLERKMILAGYRPDLAPFCATASLVALPSHAEGFASLVLEAMAARVPVASKKVGVAPEVLEPWPTAARRPRFTERFWTRGA